MHERRALPYEGGRLRARCAAVHPDGQDRGRREPDALRAAELLPPLDRGDGGAFRPIPRRDREHGEDRGDVQFGVHLRQVPPAGIQGAGGLHLADLFQKALCGRLCRALRRGHGQAEGTAGIRGKHDREDGLRRLFSHRLRFCALRQERRHSRRPGARQRGGQHRELLSAHHGHRADEVRSFLRALSQSRARVHARYRHGLRRYPPRRGRGLRPPQVRRRPCGADRDLRHDGGARRDPRRGPRAEYDLRRLRCDRQARTRRAGKSAHHARRRAQALARAARKVRERRAGEKAHRHGARP